MAGGDHFYTTSETERDSAISEYGYSYENIAAYVHPTPVVGSGPLYRLVSHESGEHFYTASEAERDEAVTNLGYQIEEVTAFVHRAQAEGTVPLFRLVVA